MASPTDITFDRTQTAPFNPSDAAFTVPDNTLIQIVEDPQSSQYSAAYQHNGPQTSSISKWSDFGGRVTGSGYLNVGSNVQMSPTGAVSFNNSFGRGGLESSSINGVPQPIHTSHGGRSGQSVLTLNVPPSAKLGDMKFVGQGSLKFADIDRWSLDWLNVRAKTALALGKTRTENADLYSVEDSVQNSHLQASKFWIKAGDQIKGTYDAPREDSSMRSEEGMEVTVLGDGGASLSATNNYGDINVTSRPSATTPFGGPYDISGKRQSVNGVAGVSDEGSLGDSYVISLFLNTHRGAG
jgi:hypothetical protein